jgi:DNA uptake protein ComE-like DNA-binding protein
MKTQTNPSAQQSAVAAAPVARIGLSHGYRFDGDTVFLNASFHADAGADLARTWSLRLVATPNAPATGLDVLAAHVVTEVALPPLAELTGAVENFEITAGALFPATKGFHNLSLALVARDTAGSVVLHDFTPYALAQSFVQPRLSGPVGLWFESDTELVLDLDHVENPRADNLSGTLSVEVWALDAAYTGGEFEGQPVAGAILGSLTGGDSWTPGALHLHATKPANPRAHLVVMLREWNGAAYVTRHFVTFAPAPAAPVAVASAATTPVAALVSPVGLNVSSSSVAPAVVAVAPAVATKPSPASVVAAAPVAAPAAKVAAVADTLISINTATAPVLTTVKGLTRPIAAEIIKQRPFATLEELSKVKGIGPASFKKLKPFLKL